MTSTTVADDISKRVTWSIVMGVLTAAIGIVMIVYPMAAATVTTIFVGWSLFLVGLTQLIFAFQSAGAGHFFLKLLTSLLYGITGLSLVFYPISGVAALTIVVGSVFIVQAALLIATAFQLRPIAGWGWFLTDGIADAAIAILILAGWPSSSYWAIGTLVGVAVLMTGISRIIIASRMKSGLGAIQNLARGAA
jgi:uncharacterized membrane protein HdeD (DUF308 family)